MTGKDGIAVQNFEAVNRTVGAAVAVVAKVQMLVLVVVQGSFPHLAAMEYHLPLAEFPSFVAIAKPF